MIEFKTFNMKIDIPQPKEIEVLGNKIKVSQFLSSADKRDLLLISLQESIVDHIINSFYLDINFHINLIKMYSDIIFDEEDDNNVFDLFDKLQLTGIFDAIICAIPEEEYVSLQNELNVLVAKYEQYSGSVASIVNSFIEQLPTNVEDAQKAIEQFDPETMKQIIELARNTGYQK